MATRITIDPVTRIEGHLKIDVMADVVNGRQQVVDARATGTLFRGIESVLEGRDPFDAPDITARICGVCPTPHNQAAVTALDAAMGLEVPANARLLRNLVLAADFLHSHVLHFYQLAVLDFIVPPAMAPWQPAWTADIRIDAVTSGQLIAHYVAALDVRRKAHEMGAVFGGRLPHTAAFIGGGFTCVPTAARIAQFRAYAAEIHTFVRDVYLPDVDAIAAAYGDYFEVGVGPGNLLAFGGFEEDACCFGGVGWRPVPIPFSPSMCAPSRRMWPVPGTRGRTASTRHPGRRPRSTPRRMPTRGANHLGTAEPFTRWDRSPA
jgi:hydrogenase large subunit